MQVYQFVQGSGHAAGGTAQSRQFMEPASQAGVPVIRKERKQNEYQQDKDNNTMDGPL